MKTLDDQLAIPQFKLGTSDNYGVHTFDIDGQLQNNRDTELLAVQIVATFVVAGQTVPFKIMLMEGSTSVPIDKIGGVKFRVSSMSDNLE